MTYLLTHSGKKVFFEDPQPDQICLEDVFLALTRIPRFGGHTRRPYSVAEHSLKGAVALEKEDPSLALEFLLHDAAEAYLGDVPTPLKSKLPGYKKIEHNFDLVIRRKYGLPEVMSPGVKLMDRRMLLAEKNALMPDDADWHWTDGVEPADDWHWTDVEPADVTIASDIHFVHTASALIHGMRSLFDRHYVMPCL